MHFSRDIERESEEALFPREIELKEKEEQQRGIGTNPKERVACIPRKKFSIYVQFVQHLKERHTSIYCWS